MFLDWSFALALLPLAIAATGLLALADQLDSRATNQALVGFLRLLAGILGSIAALAILGHLVGLI